MKTITVEKANLLKTLQENRDVHRDLFERALVVYREKVIQAFEDRLEKIKAGDEIITYINLPQPEDHTADFDTAIQMLEWDKSPDVELTLQEFKTYVQNEWGWRASFAANTMSYSEQLDATEHLR